MPIIRRRAVQKYPFDINWTDPWRHRFSGVLPAFRVRTYQLVRAATLQHVVGAEYPKARLFDVLNDPAR